VDRPRPRPALRLPPVMGHADALLGEALDGLRDAGHDVAGRRAVAAPGSAATPSPTGGPSRSSRPSTTPTSTWRRPASGGCATSCGGRRHVHEAEMKATDGPTARPTTAEPARPGRCAPGPPGPRQRGARGPAKRRASDVRPTGSVRGRGHSLTVGSGMPVEQKSWPKRACVASLSASSSRRWLCV
jgi:hypothetical protein